MRLMNLKIEARSEAQAKVVEITNKCADENRDPTEAEDATLTELRASIETLDPQIKVLQKDEQRSQDAPEPARPLPRKTTEIGVPGPAVVRSEPGTYEGPRGFQRMLVDMAIRDGKHSSTDAEFKRSAVEDRMDRYAAECTNSDELHMRATAHANLGGVVNPAHVNPRLELRATAQTNLGGIVNPQYDPSMVSRGIADSGVTLSRLRRYPVWSTGDSITMPRVTTSPESEVQVEAANFAEGSLVTAAVKADLFTVGVRAPISVQAAERGVLAVELLQDEMLRFWIQRLNELILMGSGAANQPTGLLHQAGRGSQFIEKDDGTATANKALDYMTDAKTAVWKAVRRRITDLVTSPGMIGLFEQAKDTQGGYVIPPYGAWAQNVGGAGGLPMGEGMPPSEMEWRRVPVCADAAIPDAVTDTGNSYTTGDQSRIIALVQSAVPVFYDGPMSFSYDQTLAASGQLLLVARGYAAFNPLWRPEGWRVVRGTGLKLDA